MSTLTQLLLLVPCVLSCITTGIYAYIAYQNFKKPKDEIWETAARLCASRSGHVDANDFAQTYEQLKFFKDNGCQLNGYHLQQLIQDSRAQEERARWQDTEY